MEGVGQLGEPKMGFVGLAVFGAQGTRRCAVAVSAKDPGADNGATVLGSVMLVVLKLCGEQSLLVHCESGPSPPSEQGFLDQLMREDCHVCICMYLVLIFLRPGSK